MAKPQSKALSKVERLHKIGILISEADKDKYHAFSMIDGRTMYLTNLSQKGRAILGVDLQGRRCDLIKSTIIGVSALYAKRVKKLRHNIAEIKKLERQIAALMVKKAKLLT